MGDVVQQAQFLKKNMGLVLLSLHPGNRENMLNTRILLFNKNMRFL